MATKENVVPWYSDKNLNPFGTVIGTPTLQMPMGSASASTNVQAPTTTKAAVPAVVTPQSGTGAPGATPAPAPVQAPAPAAQGPGWAGGTRADMLSDEDRENQAITALGMKAGRQLYRQGNSVYDQTTGNFVGTASDFTNGNMTADDLRKTTSSTLSSSEAENAERTLEEQLKADLDFVNANTENAILQQRIQLAKEGGVQRGVLEREQQQEMATQKASEYKLGRAGTDYAKAEITDLDQAQSYKMHLLTLEQQDLLNKSVQALRNDQYQKARELKEEADRVFNNKLKLQQEARAQKSAEIDDLVKAQDLKTKTFELASKNSDVFSMGVLSYGADGTVELPSDAELMKYAEETGLDVNMLKASAMKQAQSLNKLSREERKQELDIANAQKELALKGLSITEKNKAIDPDMGSYEKNILVSRVGKQIYGTKISDAESKRVQGFIEAGAKLGKTEGEIMDDVIGFTVTNQQMKPLAESLRNTLLQGAGDDGLVGFDMYGVAKLLNAGKTAEAVNKVEKMILSKQDDDDTKNREAASSYITTKGDSLISQIDGLKNKLGITAGNWEKVKKKVSSTPEFQKLSSDLIALTTEWRNKMLGAAVTPSEQAWMDDFLAKTTDNPLNAIEKIKSFQNMNMEQLNSRRALYGMPSLDKTTLGDMNERASLYKPGFDVLQSTFDSFYKNNADQRAAIEKAMQNKIMGATREERMRNVLKSFNQVVPEYSGKSEPLSMGEKGSITEVTIGNTPVSVSTIIATPLQKADAEFFRATGKHLAINEAVRSRERQAELYERFKSGQGGRAAPPGQSFHEIGNAIDVANWKEAEPYLRKYGFRNDLEDDKNHFSIGEFTA